MITMDGDDTQEKLWQKVQRKLWLNISKLLKKTKKTIKNYIGSIQRIGYLMKRLAKT